MLILDADIPLDANGHGEDALLGLIDAVTATVDLIAVEYIDGPQGKGKMSYVARGSARISDIAKPDGTREARLYIDNGEPNAVVRALVEQR